MKKKYKTHTGKIVELDEKEFNNYPFNSRMEFVANVEVKKKVYKKKIMEDDLNGENMVS